MKRDQNDSMASLVADYGSESEAEEEERLACPPKTEVTEKLPSPKFLKDGQETQESGTRSVFSNPYKEAEEAQKSLLEKHVKMTSVEKQNTLNGKQICWNFRKGKCRFGHNCKFAHDSDAPVDNRTNLALLSEVDGDDCNVAKPKCKTKSSNKRPGLSDGLVPSKKVMKMYRRQNANLSKV